jgi:hypothetical protein
MFGRDSNAPDLGRVALIGCCLTVAAGTMLGDTGQAEAASPALTVTPGGSLHDGQTIDLSVGPNTLFTPHARVNVLECADPHGTAANLPTDLSTCDGNTIQANTVLVGANGSFSVEGYTVFQLPSTALGELANYQPVCNVSNPCVFYIGQDQNDFTAPKIFSAAFSVGPASGAPAAPAPAAASGGSNPSTPSGSTGSAASHAGSVPAGASSSGANAANAANAANSSGSLANTGPPNQLPWTLAIGTVLLIVGSVGRRLSPRAPT